MKEFFKVLKSNWKAKLLSLIVAIIIWLTINAMTSQTSEYNVILDLSTGLSQNFELLESNVKVITVKVYGNREFINQEVSADIFHAMIDYTKDIENHSVAEGTGIYKIKLEPKIRLPESKVLYSYEPTEVQITLNDKEANRIVTESKIIQPDISAITPGEGYIIKAIKTSPKNASVTGKLKIVNRIEYLKTDKIEISDISQTVTYDIQLIFPDPNTQAIISEPTNKKVSVTIEIEEATRTKEFTNLKINAVNLDKSLSIANKYELILGNFSITGQASIIREITSSDIKPYINLSGMRVLGEFPKDIKIEFTNKISSKLENLKYFYSPQTIYIVLKKSFEDNIQDLGKFLFSKNLSNNSQTPRSYIGDRAGVTNSSNEGNETGNNND